MESYRTGPKTKRLQLRAFTVDDAEAVFAFHSNPDVMRFTGEPMLASLQAAKDAIANYPDFDTVGYGRWACLLKQSDGEFVYDGILALRYATNGWCHSPTSLEYYWP